MLGNARLVLLWYTPYQNTKKNVFLFIPGKKMGRGWGASLRVGETLERHEAAAWCMTPGGVGRVAQHPACYWL